MYKVYWIAELVSSNSMQQGLMVWFALSLPVVTTDTTQSTISSNERLRQQRHQPYSHIGASITQSR